MSQCPRGVAFLCNSGSAGISSSYPSDRMEGRKEVDARTYSSVM